MGNQSKFTKKQSRKTNVFLYIFVQISHFVNETHTVGRETPFLSLPAFLSRSSECCGRTKFLLGFKPNNQVTKITSVTLISGLMPSSIDSKTLVKTEKGFRYLH